MVIKMVKKCNKFTKEFTVFDIIVKCESKCGKEFHLNCIANIVKATWSVFQTIQNFHFLCDECQQIQYTKLA